MLNKKTLLHLLMLLVLTAMTACDSLIYDDEGDCTPHYMVSFKYDYNLKFADAFAAEVDRVTLHVFDTDGKRVFDKTMTLGELAANGYRMEVGLPAGTYEMLAWADGLEEDATGFSPSADNRHDRRLDRKTSADGRAFTDSHLHSLFHGRLKSVTLEPMDEGEQVVEMPLVKDTNIVRVMLQYKDGKEMPRDRFDFYLTGSNGWLDRDNTLLPDEEVDYRAWSVVSGTAGMPDLEDGPAVRTVTSVSAVVAEMTTSRLIMGSPVYLTVVRRADNYRVLRIPLIDYAIMVKGNHRRKMTDQEYLDRQDEYPVTIFLEENDSWEKSAGVFIESWHVVLHDQDLGK